MIENENNSLISYDEGITDKQVKFLSSLFSQSPKKIGLKTGEKAIYDLATQYFVFGELNIPIYGDFEFKILINKIVKEVWGDFLDIDEIDEYTIDEFRKYFYRHPDFTSILFEFINSGTELKMFNEYLKYVIEYKILKDEDLNSIREVRKYLYMSSGATEQTGNLFDDLYNFLHFHRFVIPGGIDESERKTVLNNIVEDIKSGEIDNPLEFKSFKDRNKFPDKYLNAIEKLILKTYTYDPLKHTVKAETCKAIDKINLQILKDSLSFNPRGRQRYDLIFESRENLVANCRRCVRGNSKIRMSDGSFKLAYDLKVGDTLLASDKRSETTITHVESKKDKIYKLTLQTGEEIFTTGEHRFPTQNEFKNGMFTIFDSNYKSVLELGKGDMIPTSLGYESRRSDISVGLAKLIGYILGDGCILSGCKISKKDKDYQRKIINIIESEGYKYHLNKDDIVIYDIFNLLKSIGIYKNGSAEKFIPDLFFSQNNEIKWGIIEGLLNTDGYIGIKKGKTGNDGYNRIGQTYIEYSSISGELIKGLHILLNDLGIINYIKKKNKDIKIGNKVLEDYSIYYLYITDKESIKNIFGKCDMSLKKNYKDSVDILNIDVYNNSSIGTIPLVSIKQKKFKSEDGGKTINGVRYPRYNYQRHKCCAYGTEERLEYQWSAVISVEEWGYDDVIDIEVTGDHLFWVDNVLSHNTGKSFLAVYLSIRQIMLPQQLVLYILPNKEGFSEQPFYYIEKMFDNLKTAQGIEGNIPGLQFNNKTFKVINKELKSKILFISAVGGTKGGRSFSANLIIMDEAGYTEDADMYDVSYSATTDTRGRMRAISTINKDTPINRFFYKKIDLDGGNDSLVTVVDIYNNEFIPDDEKIKLEQKHKIKNPKIWLSEYMAIFVGQGDTFDISGFFRMDFDYDVLKFGDFSFKVYKKLEQYTHFVVNRDPGRDVDPGGVTIIGIKNRNQADVICSGYMRIPNYIIQANAIMEMYEYFKKMKPTDIVLDLGKVGIGMMDYMNSLKVYPYGVTSTGGNTINNPSPRQYNMSSVILEGNLKNIMNTGILKGFSRLESIRHEYETYEASKTRQGTQHHHDILSSLMIGVSTALERNWLSFRKAHEELPKSDDELLYETMAKYQPQENNKFLY